MRYFVTGATGFIGGRLTRRLLRDGHEVVALVRSRERAHQLLELGVAIHEGDITARASLRAPMDGVDGVFHVAAWYKIGARDRAEAERINVGGTRNVLETMREAGVRKGVYTSTLAVFGDTHGTLADERTRHRGPWPSEYDRTKWLAHYEVAEPLMAAGLPLVIVQPGLVYGPGDTSQLRTLLIDYLRGRLLAVPQRTAFCWGYVDDTVEGHVLAMEQGRTGKSYIIAGPPYTLRHVFEIAEQITGIRAPRLHPRPELLRLAASVTGLLERVMPLPEALTPEALRVIGGGTYLGSNEKARRELGYRPRPLEEGLRDTLLHEMRLLSMDTSLVEQGPRDRGALSL